MPTDTEKKLNGTPEPFRRTVIWGRPPATIFRAGPLPRAPEAPTMQFTPGILSGSMIPQAAPARPQVPAPSAVPPVARAPEPRPDATPAQPVADPKPDLTVRVLPTVEAEPAQEPVPVQAIVFAADPAPAAVPPVDGTPKPVSRVPL